jgi:hypothetical protein
MPTLNEQYTMLDEFNAFFRYKPLKKARIELTEPYAKGKTKPTYLKPFAERQGMSNFKKL